MSYKIDIEYTDTFGGQANYAWIRQQTITVNENASQRTIMRRAKAAMGLTGQRGIVDAYGDGTIEFRPWRSCTVMFVIPQSRW